MFFNLTWRNAKRSRSENLIYFLTMITAVAMFYIVLSLGQQDVIRFLSEIESDAVERLLTNLLPTVYLCALLFVFFLVVFANKYQLECRSRELGLYLMFGMTKIKLFIQIMTEGLITSFLALLGGLVCGGFLSEAISLTTARLVGHGIITHQLSFSVSAAIFTSLGFLIIQFVALFVLCGKLFRKELHQLVYGEMAKKQRTGNPYVSFVSFAIGTVILLVAYWIVVEHFMAASGAMLLIAVLLGIIGTILFIRGLARILSIWAASIKHKATRGLYVFTLRQLHENVVNKYISISVASILMMLTIMLITDGSVRIMSYGSELTRGTSVYDFTVMGNDQIVEKYLSNEQIRPYVSNLNRMEIGNIKSTASDGISSPVDWSKFRKQIVQHYLSESEIHLTIEDKPIQLLVTVVPENADNQTIAWSSSNPEVATVVDGVVTPLTAGMTTVTAVSNDGDFSASCLITVTDPGVPVRKGQSTAVPVPHHPIAPLSQNRPGGRKNQSRPKRHWPGQQSRKYLPEACQLSADILHADYLDDLRPCPGIRLHALPRQSPPGPDGFLYIPL